MAPRVSVIVNCFNGERYLREALDSIAAQTLTDFEVIFWDNGSTDGSADIARAFGPKLRYFRAAETTPLGAARNLAVAESQAEFIAFLDTDDRWYPHTLATLVAATAGGFDVCYAGVQTVDSSGRPIGTAAPPARSGRLLEPLLTQFDIYVPALLVRRSALAKSGLAFDPRITASEEYCLFVQLAAEVNMRSLPDLLADYRIHDGALTNKSVAKWAEERFYTLDRLLERHPEVASEYPAALREARARGLYYQARYEIATGHPSNARRSLRQAWPAGLMYVALWLLACLPSAWNQVHTWKSKRAIG